MKVLRYEPADAMFERSPGQDADIFAANLVDQKQGGPITIGYGRYGPDQVLKTLERLNARFGGRDIRPSKS